MKRMLLIMLTLAIVASAVGVLADYGQGDVGGVIAAQIERAIGHGGQRTGEPLPILVLQNGASIDTSADKYLNENVGRIRRWYHEGFDAASFFSIEAPSSYTPEARANSNISSM